MSKEMKWYIFNFNEEPLCWEDKVLEFDTKEKAEAFLKSAEIPKEEVIVKEYILFYDGGYINASNLIMENGELVEND